MTNLSDFFTASSSAGIKQWTVSTAYAIGDYLEDPTNNKVYRVLTSHTSSAIAPALDVIAGNLVQVAQDVYQWQATTAYPDEAFVVDSSGRLYKTTTNFTSAATIEADVTALNLSELSQAYHEYVAFNNTYRPGDIVHDTATEKLYRVVTKFTTTVASTVAADVTAGRLVELSPGGASTSTPLHWAQLRRDDNTQGNAGDWADGTRVGSGTFPWPIAEGLGAGASPNGTITITQAGRYLIEAQIIDIDGAPNAARWQIRSNGAPICRFRAEYGAPDPIYDMSTVADLPGGAVIDIFPVATVGAGSKRLGSGSFFRVVQLATESVIDPGLIVPTSLHVVSIATTTPNTSNVATVLTESGVGGYFVPNLTDPMLTRFDPNSMIVGNKVVIQQAGRYRLAGGVRHASSAAPEPGIRVNGVYVAVGDASSGPIEHVFYECVRILAVGDIIDFTISSSSNTNIANGFYLTVEQLASHNVIRPEDVVVNDQSTTGFMDIGGMRQAWGKTLSTLDGDELISFGVTFASPPVVTATIDVGSAIGAAYGGGTKDITTTTFLYNRDDGLSNADNAYVNWFAVGSKP